MTDQEIIVGDSREVLRGLAESSFHACVTDPPYGLSREKRGGSGEKSLNLASPAGRSRVTTGGFMGAEWDSVVPGPDLWREVLRVLKPGAPLLAFGGTRTFHRLTAAIEDAGFEIRDVLCWLYGTGFPKSENFGKTTPGFDGYGTALKPAWEPIVLASKPLDGTFARNATKHGVAGIAIDKARIPVSDPKAYRANASGDRGHAENRKRDLGFKQGCGKASELGRWPANVLLDEEAAKILDRTGHSDSGGVSRFFYVAKASQSERGPGNDHPTVKPLALMRYLVRLVSPPKGGRILDPFAGSGTTILAAKEEGVGAVGIEISEGFAEIARNRLGKIEGRLI